METADNVSKEVDVRIAHIVQLREEKKLDEAIVECKEAIEMAEANGLWQQKMRLHNLLGVSYWNKSEVSDALVQFDAVVGIAKEHGMEKSSENAEAHYNAGAMLINAEALYSQVVGLFEKAIEIRRSIVGDEEDDELSKYREILAAAHYMHDFNQSHATDAGRER